MGAEQIPRSGLILLDLRLPDASGLHVLRELRASEGGRGDTTPTSA
jgi:DNA-binding response OmpR family regulator